MIEDLTACFDGLVDPRVTRRCDHRLIDILMIAISATRGSVTERSSSRLCARRSPILAGRPPHMLTGSDAIAYKALRQQFDEIAVQSHRHEVALIWRRASTRAMPGRRRSTDGAPAVRHRSATDPRSGAPANGDPGWRRAPAASAGLACRRLRPIRHLVKLCCNVLGTWPRTLPPWRLPWPLGPRGASAPALCQCRNRPMPIWRPRGSVTHSRSGPTRPISTGPAICTGWRPWHVQRHVRRRQCVA